MVKTAEPNQKESLTGATFTPAEFTGHQLDVPTGRILSVVSRINDLLLAPGSQNELFHSIAQVYAQALFYPVVAILLFDDEEQEVQVVGVNNDQIDALEQRRGPDLLYKRTYPIASVQHLAWMKAVKQGQIYTTSKPIDLYAPFVNARRLGMLIRRLKIVQGIAIPLIIRGKLVGALKIGSTRAGYDPGERDDLLALAQHMAIAIEMWRLYDRAEGRTAVLKRLHNLSQAITGILDLDVLFKEVVKAAGKLTRIDYCYVNTITRDMKWYNNRALWRKDATPEISNETRSINIIPPQLLAEALQGRPILVPDITAYPQVQAQMVKWHAKSVALFAFSADNRPVGFIAVGRDEVGEWDENTVEVLKELAKYMSVAFHNSRRYAEAHRQAETQAALVENARMIAHADTDSVIHTIVRAGSQLLMNSQCVLLLANSAGDLVCVATAGPQFEGLLGYTVKRGEGLLGKSFAEERAIRVDDIQTAEGSAYQPNIRNNDPHSFLAIPMLTEHGCIGVLSAAHTEPGIYEESHSDLLGTLADHATIALEKGRLLQEAKTQAAEQAALAESAGAIARLDVYTVLQTIVTRASEIVKHARCTVLLHDEKAEELYWAAGYNNGPELQKLRQRADSGLVGHVFTTGETVLVPDLAADERPVARRMNDIENLHSLIAVPLKGATGTIGVLVLSHNDVNVFTRHDLYLLNTFADYATIALSNARLYSSLQQREEERSRLLHQILTSQEAERRRVAVDIHDGPLQSIGVTILAVDRIRKLVEISRTTDARDELVQVRDDMATIVQELRDLINDLRPAVLETLGLVVAATSYLNQFTKQTSINAHLEDELDGKRLPPTVEVIFYRLLQESLTNVRKHAMAGKVWVKFSVANRLFKMDVTDNGRGFDPIYAVARSLESGHIGLHSMQERIEVAGGGMEIDSTLGEGSRITFWIPVA